MERRRQEGHLIIADDRASPWHVQSRRSAKKDAFVRFAQDRPLLVMSFGLKYQGPNPSKPWPRMLTDAHTSITALYRLLALRYKIEGKYDIPVGFKARA